ncbi:MAG: DUF5658 family protein [Bdellovibrionota bacterium]
MSNSISNVSNEQLTISRACSLPSKEVITLGVILITLQIADAILTNIGMNVFGTSMEGNALLRNVMENYGTVAALVASKSLAVATIIGLVYLSNHVNWIKAALKCVIAIYMTFAIAPWTILLTQNLL